MPTNVQFQDVQQDIAHVRSISEELNANADSVLQLLFQLSSYQLNELMRVLTIFSAFFIPLSFIASIYGMNFTHLPLLEDNYGHLKRFM
ncbi:Mg2+ transporter protein [Trypanosoma melophagium]|uniref:Mg2+ transporter protein n=1 Tax=Trypanosoma melophagium TaxID=715481 RepID=UPI003519E934|nr:Mg2+ transporter protein [Trypanosoma melophagium]